MSEGHADGDDPAGTVRKSLRVAFTLVAAAIGVEFVSRTLFWTIAHLRDTLISGIEVHLIVWITLPLSTAVNTFTEEPLLSQFFTRSPAVVFTPDYSLFIICLFSYAATVTLTGVYLKRRWAQ